jgi:hypothetical protein
MDEGAEKEKILVRLVQIKSLVLDTQQIRMKLIQSLQELLKLRVGGRRRIQMP